MADLSQLFKIAPTTAAFMTGGQQAMDQDTQRLEQQKLQQLMDIARQKQQQDAQMAPLLLDEQRLKNQTAQVKIPGYEADNQAKTLANQFAEKTQPNLIQSTNQANDEKTQLSKLNVADKQYQSMWNLADSLESVPAPLRFAEFQKQMASRNIGPGNPDFDRLSQVPMEQLPSMLRKAANSAVVNSPAYRLQQLKEEGDNARNSAQNASREKSAAATAAAHIKAAQIAADARVAAKKSSDDFYATLDKYKEPRQKLAFVLARIAQVGPQSEEGQKLIEIARVLKPLAAAQLTPGAKPGSPNVEKLGVEANQAPELDPEGILDREKAKPITGKTTGGMPFKQIQ